MGKRIPLFPRSMRLNLSLREELDLAMIMEIVLSYPIAQRLSVVSKQLCSKQQGFNQRLCTPRFGRFGRLGSAHLLSLATPYSRLRKQRSIPSVFQRLISQQRVLTPAREVSCCVSISLSTSIFLCGWMVTQNITQPHRAATEKEPTFLIPQTQDHPGNNIYIISRKGR